MAAKTPPLWLIRALVATHVALYRLSGGRIGATMGGAPVALVTTPGRKSGKPITMPLIVIPTDRGQAIIASFAGAEKHPAWYLNVKAAGRAELELGRERRQVRAEEVAFGGERYEKIWTDAVALYAPYASYKKRTTRQIPIVELIAG